MHSPEEQNASLDFNELIWCHGWHREAVREISLWFAAVCAAHHRS
jgi:hypothetical protein